MIIIYLLLTLSTPIFAGIFHSNSSCGLNEFTCTSGECISYNDVCNIIPDCSDGSDEDLCQGYSDSELQYIRSKRQLQIRCRANQWQCRDKTCISFDGVCDGVIDCRDNSDETFALCRNNTCQSNWFRCTYGACVDGTAPCNDVQDCADNSDELLPRCRNDTNGALGTFFCESGQQVISTTDVCDGVKNCNDGSDETLRVCADKTCPSYLFQCAYGACVDQGSDCNNVEDCADGSDESLELCRPDQIFAITSTPAAVPIQPHFCVLPPYPLHGTYSVGGETKARPGDAFQFAVLNYTCSLGYGLENELGIIYCQDGTWYGEFPKCVQLCRLNKHPSVEYRCLISGPRGEEGSRECNLYEPLGTVARPDCKKPNYYSNGVLSFMRCQEGGWDNYPVCTPGLEQGTNVTIIIKDSVQIYVSQFQYNDDSGHNTDANASFDSNNPNLPKSISIDVGKNKNKNKLTINVNNLRSFAPKSDDNKDDSDIITFPDSKDTQRVKKKFSNMLDILQSKFMPNQLNINNGAGENIKSDSYINEGNWRMGQTTK